MEPQVFVWNDIEFAYTHPVPCLGDAKETACVEIVLHARPDPDVLEDMLRVLARGARLPRAQLPRLEAITHLRLIVDPITLVAYRRDVRRYLYWSDGARGPNHAPGGVRKNQHRQQKLDSRGGQPALTIEAPKKKSGPEVRSFSIAITV